MVHRFSVRYRFKNIGKGKAIRFGFKGASKVVEASLFKRKNGVYQKVRTIPVRAAIKRLGFKKRL